MKGKTIACFAAFAGLSAFADTVWLDGAGVWDRMSAGHGKSMPFTNATGVAGGRFARGVKTCAPSALYLAVNGNAISFEAKVAQSWPNKSKLTARVYRENELAFESKVLDEASGPVDVKADLAGARWIKLELHGLESPYAGWSAWGDAKFEMKPGTRPADIATLSPQLGILTPPVPKAPRINSPAVYGARPGNPFFYRVPVSGETPMDIRVSNLPDGLSFDAATRLVTGRAAKRGDFEILIEAKNAFGTAKKKMRMAIGDRIALTPPIGWNSWNAFATTVTGDIVRRTADLMESLGLLEHGWAYLTIDDGWQLPEKKFKTQRERRAPDGTVLSNDTFGDMKALADYVHSRGVKIGLYSSPGPLTCAQYEGSWMYEFQDARTYAKWGYDYLKHDWCTYTKVQFGTGLDLEMFPYVIMGQALRECGRDIVHSICQYGKANVASWGGAAGGNCWRTTGDKFDFWEDVATAMDVHENLWRYAKPGEWNDADMMLVGKTYWSDHKGTRLTPNEQYTHVSMWAMWASVMMIGCDLDGIDDFTLSLLRNDEVIAIDQDELGKAAAKIQDGDGWSCWARPLADGSIAVAMVNLSPFPRDMLFCLNKAGMKGTWTVRDVWRQKDECMATGGYRANVPGHATKLLKLTPAPGAGLRPGLHDIRDNDWFRRIERFRPVDTTNGGCDGCG